MRARGPFFCSWTHAYVLMVGDPFIVVPDAGMNRVDGGTDMPGGGSGCSVTPGEAQASGAMWVVGMLVLAGARFRRRRG